MRHVFSRLPAGLGSDFVLVWSFIDEECTMGDEEADEFDEVVAVVGAGDDEHVEELDEDTDDASDRHDINEVPNVLV